MNFDENFKELVINFVIELNSSYGFNISSDKILKIFQIYGTFDVFNENEIKSVLKSILCTNKIQYDLFNRIFNSYFKNLKSWSKYEAEKMAIKNILNDLSTQLDATKEEYSEKEKEFFDNIGISNNKQELFDEIVNNSTFEKIANNINLSTSKTLLKKVLEQDKETLTKICSNKEKINKIQNDLEKIIIYNIENNIDLEFSDFVIDVSSNIKNMFDEYKELNQNKVSEIEKIEKDIEKFESKNHRDVFTEGKNAVRSEKGYLYKDLNKLNDSDLKVIYKYIIQNANKLKSKLSKHLKLSKKEIFDYKKVIKNSVKTDMVPIELFYKKPAHTKIKIVCITDISGSCKKASQVLLSFVYALQEVFHGGVESFVFVKQLEESTNIFKNYSLEEANERTSVLVERAYSNYYNAFSEFDEKFFDRITKDTIVIYLGDARNNNNKLGTEYLEKIKNKVSAGYGKMYWLNPDKKEKWNQGDSVISEYSKYMDKTFCIETTKDIIAFLNKI